MEFFVVNFVLNRTTLTASALKYEDFNILREYYGLPYYCRIDISGNASFIVGKVNITPGFSVINLLNTFKYLDINIRNFDFNGSQATETMLVKTQEITLNFI
jgi:hypothetical protein